MRETKIKDMGGYLNERVDLNLRVDLNPQEKA